MSPESFGQIPSGRYSDPNPGTASVTETVEAEAPATEPEPVPPANTALKPLWRRWLLPVGIGFVVGLGIGGTAQGDPTESAEFIEMQDSLTEAEDRADTAEMDVDRAELGAAEVQASYDELVAKVKDIETREADVTAREAAVTEAEVAAREQAVSAAAQEQAVEPEPPASEPEPVPEPDTGAEVWNLPGPDLDCSDIGHPVTITGADYHGLDADGDGIGCEG